MALIPWPLGIEIASLNCGYAYSGRNVVRAQFGPEEQTYDVSTARLVGSVTLAEQYRGSEKHFQVLAFLEELMSDPNDNWTRMPWQRPSVFELKSEIRPSFYSVLSGAVSSAVSIDQNGIWKIREPGIALALNPRVTAGEYFGYNKRTYMVLGTPTQTYNGSRRRAEFSFRVTPEGTGATGQNAIYRRDNLPIRISGGQNIVYPERGDRSAGPWSFQFIEHFVNI